MAKDIKTRETTPDTGKKSPQPAVFHHMKQSYIRMRGKAREQEREKENENESRENEGLSEAEIHAETEIVNGTGYAARRTAGMVWWRERRESGTVLPAGERPRAEEVVREYHRKKAYTAEVLRKAGAGRWTRTAFRETKDAAGMAGALRKAADISVRSAVSGMKSAAVSLGAGGGAAVAALMIVVLLGGALLTMSGSGTSAALPLSAEVEAYDAVIRQYAGQHGIPEYVDLIKAVMMQESGGRGSDPMQASESGYNTRYPRRPNGITDAEYSIDVGIRNLAACISEAGVGSPVDLEHIRLALQGYNYCNGYIAWAKNRYGGYTEAGAVEFSVMMAGRLGWSSYGDTQYAAHVLRYYAYGNMLTGNGDQAIVQVALSQEGNRGGRPYWSWYGFRSRVSWCACFVSWCADQCGYIDAGVIPRFSLCTDGAAWFRDKGRFRDRSYIPVPGDIIFFDWDGDGRTTHVGIVERCENGRVYTIEGNSSDAVRRRSYVIGSSAIYGYGMAQF